MNKSITKKVLVVSNYALDNTTDLYRLLNKMKNDFKTLPSYIDYVTYKGTDFLNFITTKYSQGYRIIIGNFYSSQCLTVFDFLNNHDDLLLISSASTAMFPSQIPSNLIRLQSNDEKGFSLFKNNVLDSMNKVLLSVDSTLTTFPRQKKLINLNEKTFVKTVNVLYTDEDIYNLSYVRMIKRSITGNEPYKFKFFKIDSDTIVQNKLTNEANAILKTTDASNVFMILTISYAQQFLNILSANNNYGIQMIFLCDSFTSYNFTVYTQLPYGYTLINEIVPTTIDYYQRLLFNNAGYINYYTISILQFLKTHSELINNNILNDLSTKNMINILVKCNEFVNSQPTNNKKSMIKITYESKSLTTISPNKLRNPINNNIQLNIITFGAIIPATSTRDATPQTTTNTTGSETPGTKISLNTILPNTFLYDYRIYISGLKYIKNNSSIFTSTFIDYISVLLDFLGNPDFNTFINKYYTIDELTIYLLHFYKQLTDYLDDTTQLWDTEIVTTQKTFTWYNFNKDFSSFIYKVYKIVFTL